MADAPRIKKKKPVRRSFGDITMADAPGVMQPVSYPNYICDIPYSDVFIDT